MKNWMRLGVVCMGAMALTTSCLDKDYDLDKIDLTIGLGSDGLGVKVGETEKIFLENILEVDNTVKIDGNNMYYLIEDGTSDFDVEVEKVTTTVKNTEIKNTTRVLSFENALEQLELPEGTTQIPVDGNFDPTGQIEGTVSTDMVVDNVSSDVKSLKRVYSKDLSFSLSIDVQKTPNVKLGIKHIKDFEIKVPAYLHITEYSKGWTLLEGNVLKYAGVMPYTQAEVCAIKVDYVDMGEYGVPVNNTITLGEEMVKASAKGEIVFHATQPFTMYKGDYADAVVHIDHTQNSDEINIDAVTGRFAPAIDVADQQIDIAGSLPDFLKDDAVRVSVSNPTIKLASDMSQIPLGIHVSAQLNSIKQGEKGFDVPVTLPMVSVDNNQYNTVYYYQGNAPYDPEGVVAEAKQQQVNDLNTLVTRLPDYINVDFDGGKLAVQDKDYTVQLGRSYKTSLDYKVYVPFEFSNGLTIVYNDSTDSFKDDLADYTAEGLTVKAEAYSTIPLDLVAQIYAVDKSGRKLQNIHFDQAKIAPSTDGMAVQRTDVTISARLTDPTLLQQIDRLFFKVQAESGVSESTHKLMSTQYLQFKEIKLRLDGQVTGNFN